jgi:hypothetical protein
MQKPVKPRPGAGHLGGGWRGSVHGRMCPAERAEVKRYRRDMDQACALRDAYRVASRGLIHAVCDLLYTAW